MDKKISKLFAMDKKISKLFFAIALNLHYLSIT